MMNTFIIVSITPIYKRELEDKSMLLHSKKTFILLSVWPGTDYVWAIFKATRVFPILTQDE